MSYRGLYNPVLIFKEFNKKSLSINNTQKERILKILRPNESSDNYDYDQVIRMIKSSMEYHYETNTSNYDYSQIVIFDEGCRMMHMIVHDILYKK
jgi:hypothetical protein